MKGRSRTRDDRRSSCAIGWIFCVDCDDAVSAQLSAELAFDNSHGITPENVRSFLVEPYAVMVDPDDLETPAREMWVVLHERRDPREGYVVVLDPRESSWGVAEFTGKPYLTLLISANSLAEALTGM